MGTGKGEPEPLTPRQPAMTAAAKIRTSHHVFSGVTYDWVAPTINQICKAEPAGISQSIDGADLYFMPYQQTTLTYTLAALEACYAWAAWGGPLP
jgi:hypothetical protein